MNWLGLPIALGLLAITSVARADDVPISDSARQHFTAGVNLMQDPDGARYDEAYREFKAAYADSPSWKITGNLGIAAMKLERDGEAIDAFNKYLTEGGSEIDPAEKAQFTRDMQTLQAGVAKVTLESDPPGAMFVDERYPSAGSPVVNRYGPFTDKAEVGVRGGHHRITANLSGFKPSVWEFDTPATAPHPFKLEKEEIPAGGVAGGGVGQPQAYARPVPTGVFIGIAATAAFAIGGAVVGVMATQKHSDYDSLNGHQLTPADHSKADSLKKDGTTLNLVADGLFGGAVIAAGVTTVLYFTRPTKEVAAPRLQLLPAVASNGGGMLLSGHFE
jgi:hypothetical protein